MTTVANPDGARDTYVARIEPVNGQARRRQDLDFFYGKTQALKSVSIPFEEKAVTALIGPSGLRQVHPAARR